MRQGSESGEMHDYSFGLSAFAPWHVGSTLLVPLPVVRHVSATGYGEHSLIWSGWCGTQINLNTNSFFFFCLFLANPPTVHQVWIMSGTYENTQWKCQLTYVFRWTHMANILTYLGHTVHDKTTMRDAKRMIELMWAMAQSTWVCVLCVWVQACFKAEGRTYESLIHLFPTCHAPPYIQWVSRVPFCLSFLSHTYPLH